tara:strand:+ start:464 stop:712 length:249 start_codon:yes stop_codon:yes gene_type:complete
MEIGKQLRMLDNPFLDYPDMIGHMIISNHSLPYFWLSYGYSHQSLYAYRGFKDHSRYPDIKKGISLLKPIPFSIYVLRIYIL